jgi:Fe2+ or Zn2+ uptake regulation protein
LESKESPPLPKTPKGFKIFAWQTEVKGHCADCSKRNNPQSD